ncbi:MAG: rod shape-determining protein MreD [bacterium]|nr:rod shape-determining protein MreD [bacterium]
MKNITPYIFIILCALLQISVIPNLAIADSFPNIILVLILIFLIKNNDQAAILWILLGGLVLDLFSPTFFGYHSLEFTLIFILYRTILRPLLLDPAPPLILLVFIAASSLLGFINIILFRQGLSQFLPIQIIYQSLIGLILYIIISKLSKDTYRIKA